METMLERMGDIHTNLAVVSCVGNQAFLTVWLAAGEECAAGRDSAAGGFGAPRPGRTAHGPAAGQPGQHAALANAAQRPPHTGWYP